MIERPTASLFLAVTSEARVLQVRSRVQVWHAHYDVVKRLPVKCAGSSCGYCASGMPAQARYVLGVATTDGELKLLELRRPQFEFVNWLDELGQQGIGRLFWVKKLGTAKNSPVQVEVMERDPEGILNRFSNQCLEEWDITGVVASFGGGVVHSISRVRLPHPQ